MFQNPGQLADLVAWAGMLLVTGYLMGTVVEIKNAQVRELRQTHDGVLVLLHHLMSKDEYTEHHSYRVSEYATRIGARLGVKASQLEDIRGAGLLHDIGTLDSSRFLLTKAARFTYNDHAGTAAHAGHGANIEALGASLRRVISIVLAHNDRADGGGNHATASEDIALSARVIAVADTYDSLTTDRPYRQAMSPFDAKSIIEKGAGKDFDPKVVEAFLTAFRFGELDSRTAAVA
jgi:HD-GYP domain-containing protein (c-di-GMP phosphodiesterase class II)